MPRGSRADDRLALKRYLYRLLGFIAVALGAVGAVLPIMPTVPFLLLAVFFFARSSPELERKILDHPQWGWQVRDWRGPSLAGAQGP